MSFDPRMDGKSSTGHQFDIRNAGGVLRIIAKEGWEVPVVSVNRLADGVDEYTFSAGTVNTVVRDGEVGDHTVYHLNCPLLDTLEVEVVFEPQD